MPFFSRYAGITYLSYFHHANSAMNPEGRTPISSVVVVPHKSSDTSKFLHWSTMSTNHVIPEERCTWCFC
jgi:hypothetical protein